MEMGFLKELLTTAPAVASTVAVVYFFLRHIEKRDATLADTLSKMNAESIDARKRSHEVIDRCSAALVQNALATAELTKVQEKMTDLLQETVYKLAAEERRSGG